MGAQSKGVSLNMEASTPWEVRYWGVKWVILILACEKPDSQKGGSPKRQGEGYKEHLRPHRV